MDRDHGAEVGMVATTMFAVEATAIGLQSLVPGVRPINLAERLALRAAAPLCSRKPQRPLDHGLFDFNARNQLELFSPRVDAASSDSMERPA